MYARITRYQLKPGHTEPAKKQAESMRADIMALPGIQRFINAGNEDGSGYIVAIVDTKEHADESIPKVREIWGRMSEHLAEMPTPEGFDVYVEWDSA